jgi:hypothetical protein
MGQHGQNLSAGLVHERERQPVDLRQRGGWITPDNGEWTKHDYAVR